MEKRGLKSKSHLQVKKKRLKSRYSFSFRVNLVFWCIVCIGFALMANLFHMQVTKGEMYRDLADGQYIATSFRSFERGSIFFDGAQNSHILAAGQKRGYKISINPKQLSEKDGEEIYKILQDVLSVKKEALLRYIKENNRISVDIAHHLSKEESERFKKQLGKKIGVYVEKWRTYPLKRTASHVIGFLGFDDQNNFGGRYGLERFYDKVLQREDEDLYMNFFARIFHNAQKLTEPLEQQEGDIVAAIDLQTQLILEKQLASIQEKWKSESSGGIVMDAKTGEIIAMAALPNFDNNHFSQEPISVFKNPLVSNVYELGSVMKPLVVAIGLDQGVITEHTRYYDKGSVKIGKYTVNNFDKKGRGWVTVQDILNQSLNTGMSFVIKKIPKDIVRNYFSRYGFGSKSGIDLPNDSTGLVSNLKSNRDIEFANISFGQGIAVSPVSFVKAISALAHKGKTLQPHLVKKIQYTSGFSKNISYEDAGVQVLKPETAQRISKMMVGVFDHYYKGRVKFEHHSVAAKTGTAQIPAPGGGYYNDRHLHSFVGYFPATNPRFIVFLYTVYPKGVRYSSQTLLMPFRDIVEYLINYYQIPPDR